MRIVVLDPHGEPLSGANIHASIWTDEKDFKANRDIETDAEGVARIELSKTFTILRLWAGKKPYVTLFANWERAELSSGKSVPAEYTFRLESAVTAGGRVLDEKGNPIVGAKVVVHLANDPKPVRGDSRVRYGSSLAWGNDAATTDSSGCWRIDNVPNHAELELGLLVSHPDFVSDEWELRARETGITTAMLRDVGVQPAL